MVINLPVTASVASLPRGCGTKCLLHFKSIFQARMSVKLFIVGDSNVDRFFPVVKAARNDPSIQDATVLRATNLAQIKEALVPAVSVEARSHVLLACLTNPVSSFPYEGALAMLLKHCTEVFDQIKAYIVEGRGATPGHLEQVRRYFTSVLGASPMYL
jgi:hypothetical protein